MDNKNKLSIDALWTKYQKTLELLNDALEKLEQKPKTIEKIVEVERIIEVPITEYIEVPVEKIVNLSEQEKENYQNQIEKLNQEIENLKLSNSKKPKDYWGKPKTSKKLIDDLTYEQQTEQKFQRIVMEVKAGRLDINTLTNAEQDIVKRLLNQ